MRITKKKRDKLIRRLAKISAYGLEWVRDNDPERDNGYIAGSIECVGFQIACTLVQELFPNASLPVSDVVQDLQLFEFPSEDQLRKRLSDMVEHFRHDYPQ